MSYSAALAGNRVMSWSERRVRRVEWMVKLQLGSLLGALERIRAFQL